MSSCDLNKHWKNDEIIVFNCGTNICQYTCNNKHYSAYYSKYDYYLENKNIYKSLFTKYLIPKILLERQYDVVIQIRTGDWSMEKSAGYYFYKQDQLDNLADNIVKHLNTIENIDNKSIYITSDNDTIVDIIKKKYEHKNINKNKIYKHFSSCLTNDIFFLIEDFIIMSKADILIISSYSNFGRIGALMNNNKSFGFSLANDDIYNDFYTTEYGKQEQFIYPIDTDKILKKVGKVRIKSKMRLDD